MLRNTINLSRVLRVVHDTADNEGGQFHGFDSEEDLLGSDSDPAPAEPETTVVPPANPTPPEQVDPQTTPPANPAPQVPSQEEIGRAFAAQRARFEGMLAAKDQELAQLRTQTQTPAQPPTPPQDPFADMPDPVDKPDEWKKWMAAQQERVAEEARRAALAEVRPQLQTVQQHTWEQNYNSSLSRAQARYAGMWDDVFAAAGRMGAEFPSLQQDVFQSRDPGEALWRLGCRALGLDPSQVPGQPAATSPAAASPSATALSEEQIRADERQKALQEFMAQQNANPYNRAVPTVTSMPAQVVSSSSRAITVGSKQEEDLLGS